MSANGALPLGEVRARAAAALARTGPTDPWVLAEVVDAVEPPALMLIWDDPWLTPRTVGVGLHDAQFTVLCVAGRHEPGPGVQTLEELIAYTIGRLRADAYTWPQATAQAPRILDIGGLPYLTARVTYRVPVSIGSEV